MASETNRIALRLTPDLRFLPGIAGAVDHFADRVGLDPAAQTDLTNAAEEAFRTALTLVDDPKTAIHVIVEDFPGRVEITFEHHGRPWAAAAEKMFPKVNRVKLERLGRFSRLVLIEYVAPAPRM